MCDNRAKTKKTLLKKTISPNLWRPAIYPAGASSAKAGDTRRLVPFDEQLQNTK